MKGNLKAGVSIRDISPPQGLQLAGYPHFERKNIGIHDPLYASCIYLDNGLAKTVLVALDLVKYSKTLVKRVRKRVEERSAIPGGNIMISCTHTHSGPLVPPVINSDGLRKREEPNYTYLAEVEDTIVDLIIEASENTFPAKVGRYENFLVNCRVGGCCCTNRVRAAYRDPVSFFYCPKDCGNLWNL